MKTPVVSQLALFLVIVGNFLPACQERPAVPSLDLINQMDLKRGELISCGAPGKQFGSVEFESSCSETVREEFNLAMELLHSFEYDEAEKVFAKIIDASPGCAMAYWGVAMCNFHPLWAPPTADELKKGAKAIAIAKTCSDRSERANAYLDAIGEYYSDWDQKDHYTRCKLFEAAMEKVYLKYPADKEAALFYALSLDAAAAPTDKTFANQKKAGNILNTIYPSEPDHPGILHYIIHTYDYPGLAILALPAARKYATVAPSSAHALHMPSHIFTRLGYWDESISSNKASIVAAQCYAETAGIKGHWDEELHGLDYLAYAYLQKGEFDSANLQLTYLQSIKEVNPANFKVAYAFAAIPSRVVLENRNWEAASNLGFYQANFDWSKFPWQEAIVHFTRALGAIHIGKTDAAQKEIAVLQKLRDTLLGQKDEYKAKQVAIQLNTCEAWLQLKKGNKETALQLMNLAADMEDSTGKHPVTPGEVLPARELLGDLLSEMQEYGKALEAYETSLQKNPNRLNGLKGAAFAAIRSGNRQKAALYEKQLATLHLPVNASGQIASHLAGTH